VPELPEVETIVRDLRPHLIGRRITSVEVSEQALRRPWSKKWGPALIGRKVCEVRRRGKWILTALDSPLTLVFHLGMTGQLTVAAAEQPRLPHTHLIMNLEDGAWQLRFRDIRRFGSATLFDSPKQVEDFFHQSGLGPEPFDLDRQAWRERLKAANRNLKAILLDQRLVAGVGNIYADESLFAARLHPARLGRDLTAAEAERLRQSIVRVLNRAIEKRGSSIRDYVGGSGLKGHFQEEFSVYKRAGQPCPRCRAPVQRTQMAGRSTHYCPRCQKGLQIAD
jgi:formamidopyrimidine-DNA glycosylase